MSDSSTGASAKTWNRAASPGLQSKVGEVMSQPVVTARLNDTMLEVKKIFVEHDIHHLPIVDDDQRPIGLVSASDLSRLTNWRAFFQPSLEERKREHLLSALLAEEVMRQPVVTIKPEASVADAADLINQRRFHCLPVVDDRGAIIGILTAHDLLRVAWPPRS